MLLVFLVCTAGLALLVSWSLGRLLGPILIRRHMQATKAALRSLGGKALAERVLAGTVAPDDPEIVKLQHEMERASERSKRKLAPAVHVLRVVPWLLSGVLCWYLFYG